jgi:hypothetical protein
MVLTFAEDFTSDVVLSTDLTGVPTSGMYFNRGVHPIITLKNLLSFLPLQTYTFGAYAAGTTYGKYEDTLVRTDCVLDGGIIYESLQTGNKGHTPSSSSTWWLPTNLDSLRVKSFIRSSKDNLLSALALNRKLVENQYIYNVGEDTVLPSGNYMGWVFEPKGSDYTKIRINQIGIQANSITPITVYVINQGTQLSTLSVTPVNGVLSFQDVVLDITSKGPVVLAIPSQSVKSQEAYNDPLKYNGFVAYPVIGTGASAAASTWEISYVGNGMSFNISAYADSTVYVNNNLIDFAKVTQAQFEMDFLRMLVSNANARSTRQERALNDTELNRIYFEITDLQNNTISRRYNALIKETRQIISRTFDRALQVDTQDSLDIEIGTI